MRGLAFAFLAIQGNAVCFAHVAAHLGPVDATFVAGLVTLLLARRIEWKGLEGGSWRPRRQGRAPSRRPRASLG